MIGKTLGHYQITSQLGKGGMGEVYQAKDQKLGRNVAIKVLPEEFAKDTDRVARFQREAKLLASLNHPNIAAIHGLEESGGTSFLVLELIDGETLADRLKRGPIPVEESLKLGIQIAEALEAAHEKGVIHRDLKPSNIKVTPDGKVKVLDFGLAKAYAGDREEVNLSNSPTLSDAATQQGVILGTAAYMSPEQARGKAVDKRADIWAFGCVLFEMLAGRAAFSGKDVTDILAAVIRAEPEWSMLPTNLHGRLREVLERCLKKDIRDRYHDISDVRVDIQKVLTDPSGVLVQPVVAEKPRTMLRRMLPWLVAVLGIIVVGLIIWKLKPAPPPEPRQVIRLEHNLPEGQQFTYSPTAPGHALAVSHDGAKFVYSTNKGLYLRSVGELNAALIAGTGDDPRSPFFSPDGQWIGYWSPIDGKLKKIAVRGGVPVILCDVVNEVYGAIWYPDHKIIFADITKGILRVSANGGSPEVLVKGISIAPQLLPDGKSLIYTDVSSRPYRIVVQALESGKRKELFAGGGAQYLPTGHLIYGLQNSDTLFAVPFDLQKLEVGGAPVPVVEGVGYSALSDSGTLVYIPYTRPAAAPGRTLVWVDRTGKEESLEVSPNMYRYPRISPDGTKVALSITGENSDLWIRDLVRKTLTRLTFDGSQIVPVWNQDGKRVAFYSWRNNKQGIYWKAADGTGEIEQLCLSQNTSMVSPYCWSKEGNFLLMGQFVGDGMSNQDITLLSMEGGRASKPLLQDKYMEIQARISPDGRWMVYTSNESGKMEVYVRPFPDVNKGRWQVSTDGGDSPLWSPDGREIFYLNGDAVMSVPVDAKAVFSLGSPQLLFRGTYVAAYPADGTPWDIHPDGKRFLMIKPPVSTGGQTAEQPRKINIVLNWTEELKQRVPIK